MLMRRSMIVAVSLIGAATLLLIALAFAQAPVAPKPEPVPVVSEVVALRLDKAILVVENAQLRIAQMQADLRALRHDAEALTNDAQALLKALEKPGFTLTRTQAGAWVYQKVEPAKKEGGS